MISLSCECTTVVRLFRCGAPIRQPLAPTLSPLWPVSALASGGALHYKHPMNQNTIETLAARLAAAVPDGVRALGDDLEQNFQSVLRSALSQLDLVTREEFEVSRTVLARAEARLEDLERQLAELSPDD